MKAVQIKGYGKPESLVVRELPVPIPADNQILIKVHASGVNFADVLSRQGLYADAPKPPFTPGYEVAGIIEGFGKEVTGFSPGDRVTAFTDFGGYAEYALSFPVYTAKLDNSVSFNYGAAVPLNWVTAYHSLFNTGAVYEGDKVLVHAAAGGTGIAAVTLLKKLGCIVYGTAGSAKKLDFLKSIGVDFPINYREKNCEAEIKNTAGERGMDIIIDSIGGENIKRGLKLLRPNGRIITMGFASFAGKSRLLLGLKSKKKYFISPFHLLGFSTGIYGVYLSRLLKERQDICSGVFRKITDMLNSGEIIPTIDSTFSLKKASEAHRLLESRESIGKIVLTNE